MFCLSRIHEFFIIIYNDGECDDMLEPRWEFTQIHEYFINYYDNGEWEDMPYEYMGNMEEN